MIAAADLGRRLSDLEPIGLDERGTTRLAWTPEDAAAGAWFARRAEEVGLRVEVDPAGNRWAVPDVAGPWWGVGGLPGRCLVRCRDAPVMSPQTPRAYP